MSVNPFDQLASAGGQKRTLGAGEYLFHVGQPVAALFVVLEGEVHLIRHQEHGGAIILQRAGPAEILAEASLFSGHYQCDALTEKGAIVRSISKRELRERLRNEPDFAEAWAAHLAGEIQIMRLRSEILSLKTVASRLDAWLAWHGELPPKGEWAWLAKEIGISAEALYREIARRRS